MAGALHIQRDLGDKAGIAFSLDRFALVAGAQGQAERCLRLAGAAAALRDSAGLPSTPNARAQIEQQLAPVRQRLGEAAAKEAWAAGRVLSLGEAVAFALEFRVVDESCEG